MYNLMDVVLKRTTIANYFFFFFVIIYVVHICYVMALSFGAKLTGLNLQEGPSVSAFKGVQGFKASCFVLLCFMAHISSI